MREALRQRAADSTSIRQACKRVEEMLRGRPQRMRGKSNELIEPRDDAFTQRRESVHGHRNIQIAQRIHKKRHAPSHFIAEKSYSVSRLIERFHNNIFELFTQKLFDGAFILFLHLGIIGEQADGPESSFGRSGIAGSIYTSRWR